MLRYTGDVAERWVGARWVMQRGDYQSFGGLQVPTKMVVSWEFPTGTYEQIRAHTQALDFDVLRRYPLPRP